MSALVTLFIASSANAFYLPNSETKQRAANGDIEAQFKLARYHHRRGELHTAYQWYGRAANLGHSDAQNHMGSAHMSGIEDAGLPKDWEKAKYWFTKSAASGNAIAKSNLRSVNRQIQRKKEIDLARKSNVNKAPQTPTFNEGDLNKAINLAHKNRQDGIVYKSPAYWERYKGMDGLIAIFEGRFDEVNIYTNIDSAYVHYVNSHSRACENSIPRNDKKSYDTEYRQDILDHEDRVIGVESLGTHSVYMHSRFYDTYKRLRSSESSLVAINLIRDRTMEKFADESANAFEIMKLMMQGDKEAALEKYKEAARNIDPSYKIDDFFRDNHCNSATVRQMNENLWRIAHGKPSAQSARMKFPGASSEAISARNSILDPTIQSIIFDRIMMRKPASSIEFEDKVFSLCESTQIKERVNYSDLEIIKKDYYELTREHSLFDQPASFIGWRIQESRNACRVIYQNRYVDKSDAWGAYTTIANSSSFKSWFTQRASIIELPDSVIAKIESEKKEHERRQAEIAELRRKRDEERKPLSTSALESWDKKNSSWLANNKKNSSVTTTDSGLQYVIISEGSGSNPQPSDMVTVHYRGSLIDGVEFDSSYNRGQPVTLPLKGVIPGWREGIQLIKPGGKIKLYTPANLAYGEGGSGPVPPNSVLIFDVELISIN